MDKRCTVAVLTTGRQDYGILRSTLLMLQGDRRIQLRLWVGGMHLRARFGQTVDLIHRDGLPVARSLNFMVEPPDPPMDAARALEAVARSLREERPDVLLLVGDRTETLSAGVAATVCRVPVAHLHGGEESEGAIDNACRHALTKLSHLHLVSHERHANRVIQMGEDPRHVIVVGAPGLDNLYRADLPGRMELENELGYSLEPPVVLVTVHPTTLAADGTQEVRAVAAAMECVPATYIVTHPNADEGGVEIRTFWERWASGRRRVSVVEALGERRYWGLLRVVTAVLGNSSSGIIEAPAAELPVVNVGDRQKGRLHGGGVRDVPADAVAVEDALRWAVSPDGKRAALSAARLYPPGSAAARIVGALHSWRPERPPRKRFRELVWPA